MKALFHVNHLWGVGHFTRIAAIANAVVAAGGEATVLSGNTPVSGRLAGAVRLVALPAIRAGDTTYSSLVTAQDWPVSEEQWTRRAAIIAGTLEACAPDILITETFPFGRRKLAREILPLIEAAQAGGAKIVASLRDVPTPPAGARRLEECADRLRTHYDAVLIHGDPAITPLNDIWPGEIPVPAYLTGYVATAAAPQPERRGVVVSAGGGGDAAPLLRAALSAWQGGLLADQPWTFITGQHAPEGLHEALIAAAPRHFGAEILHTAPDLPARIARAQLSISRGGYNTVAETIAAGTPALVIPFASDGEPEQDIRARRFAAMGLLTRLPEADLTPGSLAAAARAALESPAPPPDAIRLDGAEASARRLAEIAGNG
ncbi:MAG: glycosyltransferase [Micropepsaceae bacterium]